MTTYVDSSALLKLYVAAAQRLQLPDLLFCTFDLRQGQAARQLGFRVEGC
jgi:hypothetical protein